MNRLLPSRHRLRAALAAGLPFLAGAATAAGQPAGPGPFVEPSLGIESSAGAACGLSGRSEEEPLPVLISVDPAAAAGAASLEPILACARSRHLEVIVRLLPPADWQKAPDPYAALDPWIHSLDRFLQADPARMRTFELGARPEDLFDPKAYAFLVEKVGTLLRALDPDARLVFGALGGGSEAWLGEIPPSRLAPYIKGIALQDPIDLQPMLVRLARDYPAVSVWLHAQGGGDATDFLRRMAEARAAGVRIVFAPGSPEEESAARPLRRFAENLSHVLPARFIVDNEPPRVLLDEEGFKEPIGFYMDPLGPERAFILPASKGEVPPDTLHVSIDREAVRQARAFDLESGRELVVPGLLAGERGGATILTVAGARGPILIRFLAEAAPRGAAETVGVTAEYELSAEEVIARMRAFEARQDRFLRHYTAKATLSYHYRAEALNEAVDYASVNRFYWRDGVGEYEETDLFINGAHWRGPAPSLPFVQAEKVKEVPIDIRLDTSYVYRLEGRERLEGVPCYVISLEPVSTERSLYSGRVWVDERTFARLRVRLVQHGLKEPITSNADEIDYGAVTDGERSYWLPLRGYRQMVFTVLGRSVAVERRATFEGFQVNSGVFDQGREEAYASGRPILRDDEKGFSYLVKQRDGTRTAQAESLRNTAFFGGTSFDASPHVGVPFAGINYFDFDWLGTGTQLDVAFAGVLLNVAWTDPKLGGTRWEMSLEGRVLGLPTRLKRLTDEGSRKDEEIKALGDLGFATLAHPLTSFSRAEFQTSLAFDGYFRSKNTDPNMVLPTDGFTLTETARWRYHRSGYLLSLWAGASHRFGWQDWGFPGGDMGSAGDTEYQKWGFDAIKAFYPGRLQKISVNATVSAGHALDRFSRFQIGEFGNVRIRGYNGADITFDRGASAKTTYQFTLARGGVSLELGAEAAVVENRRDFGRDYVAGGGLGVSWSGPWGTLMSVRTSWALGSSLNTHGSSAASRIVVIKTFGRWPFGRGRTTDHPPAPPPPETPSFLRTPSGRSTSP